MERPIGLNLARSWRPRALRDVIGQSITVSLLENSLRQGLFFPVYLFVGLRGTGKTSLGRIFAAALNCEQLAVAQRGEEVKIPCQNCQSCRAMITGAHPDFIEIDAASHTGVDQARQIIEEAVFLPVLGKRKVYLIDEAHMLSKASFNAFLKMLEEPPASVIFLLATTDPHKVIDTVRSRCFQLFLDPVKPTDLVPHLEKICVAESIAYEKEALTLIALESEGSVRDAINLIERLRCATPKITSETFFSILGCPADQHFITLFEAIHAGDPHALFATIRTYELEKFEPNVIWERLIELVRALIWAHENVPFGLFQAHFIDVQRVARLFDFSQLIEFLDLLFKFEAQFNKTTARHALIERFLYTCLQRCSNGQEKASSTPPREPVRTPPTPESAPTRITSSPIQQRTLPPKAAPVDAATSPKDVGVASPWQKVLVQLGTNTDPMLTTVLQQGEFLSFDAGALRIRFPKKFVFYQELLINNRAIWQPHIEHIFGANTILIPDFSGEVVQEARATTGHTRSATPPPAGQRIEIDVTNSEKWPLTKAMLDVFPGKITVTENKTDEQNS